MLTNPHVSPSGPDANVTFPSIHPVTNYIIPFLFLFLADRVASELHFWELPKDRNHILFTSASPVPDRRFERMSLRVF